MPHPSTGSPIVPDFTDQDFDDWLKTLFSPDLDPDDPAQLEQISAAFINLTCAYIHFRNWDFLLKVVKFDPAGIEQMIRRFHRDAYGVHKFTLHVKALQDDGRIKKEDAAEILRRVTNLGLRISSDKPRKTKIAAAFSLWLSTFRPVFFPDAEQAGVSTKNVARFCAMLNVWLVAAFFDQFGEFSLTGDGAAVRLDRLKHDLNCRALNISCLEMMYAGLFRSNPPAAD